MPKIVAKKKKPKKVFVRNGITYDSDDEIYFSMWLDELKTSGHIKNWHRNTKPYLLCEPLVNHYKKEVRLKTKTRIDECKQTLLAPSVYTTDFIIQWHIDSYNLFYQQLGRAKKIQTFFIAHNNFSMDGIEPARNRVSVVEVKPVFDAHNMTRLFINNQKFVWAKYNHYVNLIIVPTLFSATFTPKEYLKTPTGKARKLSWIPQTLKQYTNAYN